ncbi:transporter [Rhodanobacter umsongensis]|uniref:Transporter n=1 Tax=Rhodanobacter umsongensis TaxID=633153 RepID=A0ABW0JPK1_9GAMM
MSPRRRCCALRWVLAGILLTPAAWAQTTADPAALPDTAPPSPPVRQSLDDAWWTGPMLANSAATLPRGHFLIEPYLYDVSSPHSDGFGSLTYMLYGLTDRLTVGLIPVLGYNRMDGAGDSSGIGLGDVSVQAQYRLTEFHEGSPLPTISLQLQQTLPSGKYDRLDDRPGDGLGSGASTTTLQLNTQTYFWLANGRILRMRLNVAQSVSGKAHVEDASVYGTANGFRGSARPGNSFFVNAAWEYSLSRRWVLALDVTYRRNHGTRVNGVTLPGYGEARIRRSSGASEAFGFAPAVEYSWGANLGVLLGTRVITGRHTTTTITPAIAINYVH